MTRKLMFWLMYTKNGACVLLFTRYNLNVNINIDVKVVNDIPFLVTNQCGILLGGN